MNDDELAVLFGRNLKVARAKRNITQEALCEMADLDRSYLSKVENGTYKITLHKVYSLCKALSCPLDELLPDINSVKFR